MWGRHTRLAWAVLGWPGLGRIKITPRLGYWLGDIALLGRWRWGRWPRHWRWYWGFVGDYWRLDYRGVSPQLVPLRWVLFRCGGVWGHLRLAWYECHHQIHHDGHGYEYVHDGDVRVFVCHHLHSHQYHRHSLLIWVIGCLNWLGFGG